MSRYRFPIAILILSALTFGLFITASPSPEAQAAPRTIPWDCSDWQASPAVADADDARVSMILESLAANRGKSIYCAIDQSDTWTKSETWLAGRDRNERDDTVYFGQQGNFRGFLAAQEGYLTDGESGVTGVSRDLIFEFPREERKRRRYSYKKLTLSGDFQWGFPDQLPAGTLLNTGDAVADAKANGGAQLAGCASFGGACRDWFNDHLDNGPSYAADHARTLCRPAGYPIVREKNIRIIGGNVLYYSENLATPPNYQYKASYQQAYSITCLKRVRRR